VGGGQARPDASIFWKLFPPSVHPLTPVDGDDPLTVERSRHIVIAHTTIGTKEARMHRSHGWDDPHDLGRHSHHHDQGQWWGRRRAGPPPGAGRRARRGDVRTAVLGVLADHPLHGYEVIRELEERSGGMWRPSPGSVYPTLQMLEDEDLVTSQEQDGKKVFALTDAGRAELQERRDRAGGVDPWDVGGAPEGFAKLRDAGMQLAAAAMQVARAGDPGQMEKAVEILTEARRKIYELLAAA
jgi:DNA-binding PadR family transcriptional regulator